MSSLAGFDPAADRSLAELRDVLQEATGLLIPTDRTQLWQSRLGQVLRSNGLVSTVDLSRRILSGDQSLKQALVDAMTTNETLFFRDSDVLNQLATDVLPRMVHEIDADRAQAGRPLTIWSAASSSGQEIYSLAILLDQHLPELFRRGRFSLLATDVSPAMVERCREARYSELEIKRGMPDCLRDSYFRIDREGQWVLDSRLRASVEVKVANLVRPLTAIPQCDLILLRNVLIYFSGDDRRDLLDRLATTVVRPNGALVLGASEIMTNSDPWRLDPATKSIYWAERP